MFKRLIASLLCFAFFNLQCIQAQATLPLSENFSVDQLPVPGSMIGTTAAYTPLTLKGLIVHPENALKFDFLMDTGYSQLKGNDLSNEALKIMKYFLTVLTIPEDDLWVNLSPYEKDRIIQNNFGQTVMGRDLLAEDYILKQLTASLIYPEKSLGKEFWQAVYDKAEKDYGTTQIPVNTFNKVWIVPSQAEVWEHDGKVLILKSHLKVMLDEDYLSLSHHSEGSSKAPQGNNLTHHLASKIVRQIVLPVLENEVNTGKNFAELRQMYQAMILATWYKNALRASILNKVYADQKKTKGVDDTNKEDIELIYHQYLKAFKKGAFDYIKDDLDLSTGQSIPRKYFSGGFSAAMTSKVLSTLKGPYHSLSASTQGSVLRAGRSIGTMLAFTVLLNAAPANMMPRHYSHQVQKAIDTQTIRIPPAITIETKELDEEALLNRLKGPEDARRLAAVRELGSRKPDDRVIRQLLSIAGTKTILRIKDDAPGSKQILLVDTNSPFEIEAVHALGQFNTQNALQSNDRSRLIKISISDIINTPMIFRGPLVGPAFVTLETFHTTEVYDSVFRLISPVGKNSDARVIEPGGKYQSVIMLLHKIDPSLDHRLIARISMDSIDKKYANNRELLTKAFASLLKTDVLIDYWLSEWEGIQKFKDMDFDLQLAERPYLPISIESQEKELDIFISMITASNNARNIIGTRLARKDLSEQKREGLEYLLRTIKVDEQEEELEDESIALLKEKRSVEIGAGILALITVVTFFYKNRRRGGTSGQNIVILKPQPVESDPGMSADHHLGGIDLNARLMDLHIKRDGNGTPLVLSQQSLDKINIPGFIPEIISVSLIDLHALLGLNPSN